MRSFFIKYRSDFRANLTLAAPIILGQLGQVSVNFADNVMVGRLGGLPLAGVSLANAIFVTFIVIGMGISMALAPLISYAVGAMEEHDISEYFKHSLIINIVFAFIALILIECLIPYVEFLQQDPKVLEYALPYLRISMWTLIPMMIFLTLRGYAEGLNESKPPMYAIIIGNVANVILNYCFIYGVWGFPEMGSSGAAFASLLARVIMIGVLVIILYRWGSLWSYIANCRWTAYTKSYFTKLLNLGVPSSLQMFFEISAFSTATIIMGMISSNAQAAHQIAISIASMTFMFCTGVSMAAAVRVGNEYGKGDYPKARDAGLSSIILSISFMTLTGLVFVMFRQWIPLIYMDDAGVVAISAHLLFYAAIFQIPDGIQVTALGSLRGLQDVKIPTLKTLIAYWGVGIPVSYITAINWGWGIDGVWFGLILSLTFSACFLLYRFDRLTKLKIFKG